MTRERIHGVSLNATNARFFPTKKSIEGCKHIRTFKKEIKKLGLYIDKSPRNFLRNQRGITYVDSFYEYKKPDIIADRINEAIEDKYANKEVTEEQHAEALRHLERFKKLSEVKN